MRKNTIKKLNQINQKFYQKTAQTFSRSRSYFWSGWEKITPYLNVLVAQEKEIKVFDVGCGNGRFGMFLSENLDSKKIKYFGLDFSQRLLETAKQRLTTLGLDFQLKELDLVKSLLNKQLNELYNQKFNLITAFGLFHHLPSFSIRRQAVKQLVSQLENEGVMVATFWQFANKTRFSKKFVNPEKVSIKPEELEENDFIMDWKRGKRAYRYCHHADQPEVEKLTAGLSLEEVDNYLADGKTGDLNLYLVLKKQSDN